MIKILSIQDARDLPVRGSGELAQYENVVGPILRAVREERDAALLRYARQFDGLGDAPVRISEEELASAAKRLGPGICKAVGTAASNIREFATAQMPKELFREFSPGRKLGWIVRPLEAVGCYIPSGRYPLPSTVLMTAVLAQAAEVPRVCIASPKPSLEIMGCAHLLGIREVYRVGGAQAIAAMAYGTETIARVSRIVGPGNVYVSTAKKLLAGEVGIDFVAGPTEIAILAEQGDPRVIAADMLAQAEHDVTASAMLITTSRGLAEAVSAEIEKQLKTLPTADVARQSIDRDSAIFVVPNTDVAVEVVNSIAPEHLSLHDAALLPKIQNAGAVFLGAGSPEAAGDYAAGPSHVLPTTGVARLRGGLTPADFVKIISVQQLSPTALQELSPAITALARAEGLEAHARSVEVRLVQ